ncbi:MAG: 3-phosphoshikimate 1-carboxyvinyltransferase [Ignavibacteriaceae bacterium]|nr:3-phosphoshikimate 1-carboxyvinyltransferase [Ignavibacterium sp.]MCC6256435.1 3-phosphoshikimate 1-carboxyvinyltransferase [Ignavibacteriaceae bacterium]HRN26473.1 3-phosphoshikimate 1-carboxyvinyltransferase [Ignavibacteriaceae bacterium]HRP92059.1 3-phosphoshikimate 1-carboxyvinyltransferase [Ignavibacteriaceae bacterium]HRQ53900.1 3-phosphoshikimate 1-carboxyvinyltransferase [Ignavibacteriaceae bacterium]
MQRSFNKIKKVSGELSISGDKSISHRAIIFSAMASDKSSIKNISQGEDVKSTIKIVQQLGAEINHRNDQLIINGCGFKKFTNPKHNLDCGNSGTSARLIVGLLSAQNFTSTLIGDDSLSNRPMKRVIEPLQKMGAEFKTNVYQTLPLTIKSNNSLINIRYEMPIASAQVKSAILIAGLHLDDETNVIENKQSRNHTEKMLGLPVSIVENKIISSACKKYYPTAKDYFIPGDISSAAFYIVLTLLTPNSELLIKNVSLNPTRTGFIDVLKKMGADISFKEIKISSNEEYGDVIVKSSSLKNIKIDSEIIPNIIDEIPILSIAGIFAEGSFEITNASELRIKESDRINSICSNLKLLGLIVDESDDGFCVKGEIRKSIPVFESFGDHRIAMTFAILSMILDNGGAVSGFECAGISNPMFEELIKLITN